MTTDGSGAGVCRQFFVGRMQIRVADTSGRLELTTKGGKCGCSSSILSFRNYNHEKRCTKGGAVLSFISFHLSVPAGAFAPRRPQRLTASFRGANLHRGRRRKSLYCRRAGRRLCSPPPAKAYDFVSGSKIFTKGGGGNRFIAGVPAADFAPRRPQRLTASFRGAKSSHKAAAENALSPAHRPPPLLPAARKGLRFRFGEQKVHTRRRRKSPYCRRAGRGLCSPPPAKAYGSVSGSKKFTQGGGENRLIAGSPAADFAPRRPQRHTASFGGAKSSHKEAAENAL